MEEERQAIRRSRKILDLIPSGVGVYDVTDATISMVYLNDGYYQMIGADRRQFEGTNAVMSLHPDDLPGLMREVEASVREGRPLQYRYRCSLRNGEFRWLFIRANHVPLNSRTERFYASYYDIDDMVRTQEKLQEREMLISETMKYSGTAHFFYYPALRRYEAVALPELYKKLPPSMDDFPESFIRFVQMPAEDAEQYRGMIRAIDAGAEEAECTVRVKFLGQLSWLRVRCRSIFDGSGRVTKAVGSSVPMDSYVASERELWQERQQMKSLQGGLVSVVSVNVTKDRCFRQELLSGPAGGWENKPVYRDALEAEPAVREQSGETLNILLSAAEQIPDAGQRRRFIRMCSHAGLMRLYSGGKRDAVLEYRRKTPGGLIWVATRLTLTQDPDTGDILAGFYTSNINERMIYRKITEVIIGRDFETVMYCDLATQKVYLKNADVSSERFFTPLTYAQALETAVRQIVPEEASAAREKLSIRNLLSELAKTGVYSLFFTCVKREESLPDKPLRHIKYDISYLDGDRDILVLLQSDVTAVYEQEQSRLRQMQSALNAAERANESKSAFLSSMSHDMRTPLNGVIGYTDLALREKDLRKKDEYLAKIRSSGELLTALINDTLELSRIESGKVVLEPEAVDGREISESVVTALQASAVSKGVAIIADPERFPSETLWVDKLKLQKIFLNLIANAIKFTPAGGTVRVSVEKLEPPVRGCNRRILVEDTGIGMSPEFVKKAFEPFSQENRLPNAAGTGLGLSIVKRIVDLMGGTVEVRSEIDRGTRFAVDLPVQTVQPTRKNPEGETAGAASLAGRRVLLCEDNELNTEIAVMLLRERGILTDTAGNGQEGLEKFRRSAEGFYDAVLMDIRMPVMDGLEAARAIRRLARADAERIPIIAMSADAFEEDRRRAEKMGMNAYVTKPIEPGRLLRTLSACIAASSAR